MFFGPALALVVAETVRPRLKLRLDAEGVHRRQAFGASGLELPWDEIASVGTVKINRSPLVVFVPHDPGWGLEGPSPAVRAVRRANGALAGSWMTFSPTLFGANAEALVAEIEHHRRAALPGTAVEYPRPL